MNSSAFLALLTRKQHLVLDGATGTNLQKRGLPVGSAPESWLFENPDAILQLYSDFVNAGSDIILTCTFGGNRVRLAHAGLENRIDQVHKTAVGLAKQAVGNSGVLVAGSIGPTGEMIQPFGNLSEDQAYDVYRQQAQALIDNGVDLIVVETQFDLAEAQAALTAVRSVTADTALVCSFSYDRGQRTMMGVKPGQMAEIFNDMPVDVLGINCGRSLEDNLTVLKILKEKTSKPVWFKPNAGLPEAQPDGSMKYSVTPQMMADTARTWLKEGASLVGGCCGTSPEHVREIALAVKGKS